MAPKENNQPETTATKSNASDSQKFIVAVIILTVYIIFIGIMLYNSDDPKDLRWNRMLYLFSGIEAIVFAALGYVFGKDIHRVRAESAEKNAEQAKRETDKAKKETDDAKKTAENEKIKGIKLSTAILARNVSILEDNTHKAQGAGGAAAGGAIRNNSGDDYLVGLAKSLYAYDETPYSTPTISFQYTISPADKIDHIIINKEKQVPIPPNGKGYYSGVPIPDNMFTIQVAKKSEFVEWTFMISDVWQSDGIERKQKGGKLIKDSNTANVQLEKL